MWLARLDLLAFGHFTDVRLQLGPGFHLVYGPNEAGKTTTLRAIRQLLFGFDERTRDNFVHQNPNLRIGGLIRNHAGIELDVVRRKSRKESLRAADEATNIDVGLWQSLLCGCDEATFLSRYGIDYEQLVKGGHEIATGSGDLGEILFATGSGITDLTTVQKRMNDEAGELFRPQGKKQRLNQAIVEWQEQRVQVIGKLLLVSEWEEVDRSRRITQAQLDSISEKLTLRSSECDRYRRQLAAWPLVRNQESLETELATLSSISRLPVDFGVMRQEALVLLKHADSQELVASTAFLEAQLEIERLTIPIEILNRGDDLTQLVSEWGSYRKAQLDRPQIFEQFDSHASKCRELLKTIGHSPEENLNLEVVADRTQRTRLNQLGRQQASLSQAIQQAESRCDRLRKQIDEIQRKLVGIPIIRSSEELREAVRQSHGDGDLEKQLQKVNDERSVLESEERRHRDQLGHWTGTIADLKSIRTPTLEIVNRWESEFDSYQNEKSILKSQLAELESERRRVQQKMDELRHEYDLPMEVELDQARKTRDESLAQLRKAIVSKKVPPDAVLDSLDQGIVKADRLADRLRSEAARVAQFNELSADLTKIEARQSEISVRRDELEANCAAFDRRWKSEWPELGAVPTSPRDVQTWLARRDLLLQNHAQMARRSADADKLSKQIQVRLEVLSKLLFSTRTILSVSEAGNHTRTKSAIAINLETGTEPTASGKQLSFGWDRDTENNPTLDDSPECDPCSLVSRSLREVLILAEERLQQDDLQLQSRKDAEDAAARLRQELAEALEEQQAATNALAQWQAEWEAELVDLNMEPGSSPDAADVYLLTLSEYADHQRQCKQLLERIDGIDADASRFEARVKSICHEIAADLNDVQINDAVAHLRDRLLSAQKDQVVLAEQTSRKIHAEEQLSQARQSRLNGQEIVVQLCQLAGVSYTVEESVGRDVEHLNVILDALAKAESEAGHRKQLEEKLAHVQTRIFELAAETTIADFLAQLQLSTPEQLAARICEIDEECRLLAESRDLLNRQLGGFDEQLQRMNGGADAAEAEEKQRQLFAQIQSDVEQYARIKLASSVLHLAVERYREKIRGPVLNVAGDLFRELTLNSFDGLRVDEDDNNKPILVGIRKGGREAVTVEGMSEGTCDQLYLALRLASLLLEAAPRSQLPFIVDDILIQFDDARSAAALRILSRLGRQRQVIFFTHNEHLLEIARQNLAGEYSVQRLGV